MEFSCAWPLAAVRWSVFWGREPNTTMAVRQQERCTYAAMVVRSFVCKGRQVAYMPPRFRSIDADTRRFLQAQRQRINRLIGQPRIELAHDELLSDRPSATSSRVGSGSNRCVAGFDHGVRGAAQWFTAAPSAVPESRHLAATLACAPNNDEPIDP